MLCFATLHWLTISQNIFILTFCGNTYRRILLFKQSPTSESLVYFQPIHYFQKSKCNKSHRSITYKNYIVCYKYQFTYYQLLELTSYLVSAQECEMPNQVSCAQEKKKEIKGSFLFPKDISSANCSPHSMQRVLLYKCE